MSQILDSAKRTFLIEAEAIANLSNQLTEDFELAVKEILNSDHVIVTGVGKSGIIARKIVSTLSSLGTPAVFLHSTDACHGDLGVVSSNDIVLIISNSGETEEVLKIIPFFHKNGNKIIAMTGQKESVLAKKSAYILDIAVEKEACTMNLAPTASTTAMLAMGDALAIALQEERKFSEKDFARSHFGGALSKKCL